MTQWHSLAACMLLLGGGCFASVVDGRPDVPPDGPDVGSPPPVVDAGTPVPEPDAGAPSCEPAPETGPEIDLVPVGNGGNCRGDFFAEPRNVLLEGAVVSGGVLRFDVLTSLARDRDYRCAIEVRGVGAEAEPIPRRVGSSRFLLVQLRDGALSVRPNDIFCEAPCDLPLTLWVGTLRLPANGPLPATEWLELRAGESECVVTSRCSQPRFPLVAEARGLVSTTAPGLTSNGVMPTPIAGAGRLDVHVYSSGVDCGPDDGGATPLVSALVHHWQDADTP